MRPLWLFSIAVFVAMVAVTIWASLDANVLVGFQRLLADRWGVATLCDAYFGFLWFWLWILYKEASLGRSLLWLLLLFALGNLAMAGYMLIQLYRLPPGAGVEALLLRRDG
ncbi:MAG: DUF1475 family protein [Geothrix sp.]|uniref:DUF1475 family protein n=1 Tax=Geothrix sp. TaxID=1962974 RepID=UPI0017C886C6|nr:DUF1475 family protein [Geothrix sp.]NWJ42118.1 DUF1475 family protein [Geothrix sp.]WIL19916.1 MAG: DUF1475 family protein [Geothrix sp.]